MIGRIGSWWGVLGILALLGMAVFQLSKPALATFTHPLSWYHWLLLLVSLPFFLYFKAYRGFQRALSPRIATRARKLQQQPALLRVLFAPFYCIGFFGIERRKQVAVILMTAAMVLLVLLVRGLEQPWRGIIDVGIVLALAWGFVTILVFSLQSLTGSNRWQLGAPRVPEHPL